MEHSEALKKQIELFAMGIKEKKPTKNKQNTSELFVMNYFKNLGYNIIRTQYKTHFGRKTELFNKDVFNLTNNMELSKASSLVGVPDLLCYKNDGDYFFVEIKTSGTGLNIEQLNWFFGFNYKIILFYIVLNQR